MSALLVALAETPSIVDGLRLSDDLAIAAAGSVDGSGTARLLDWAIVGALQDGDALTAIGAIHALGRVADDGADAVLVRLVHSDRPSVAGHAAWVLGGRIPDLSAVEALVAMVVAGGFEAMLAQRTLVQWSAQTGRVVAEAVGHEILRLRRRPAAGVPDAARLPSDDDVAGAIQRLVDTLQGGVLAGRVVPTEDRTGDGRVTVVQPFLHARLDAAGSRLGAGDAGGIASLLRSLGTSLAQHPDVREVVTVTRANPTGPGPGVRGASGGRWEGATEALGAGHRLVRIRYGPAQEVAQGDAWIHRLAIERELTRLAATLTGPVVWHLRMADIGTLAAAAVARRFGHRVVFTAAPDPHGLIVIRQRDGGLDRAGFGAVDGREQLWFRARLVERLVAGADRLVVFPRPDLRVALRDLLGIDVDDPTGRVAVIPEGVDTAALDRAERRRAHPSALAPVVARVREALPPARRDRPWLVSVGRLNPLKGPQRLVEAWAGSAALREHFNLVVVGGDLTDPSAVEWTTLELICDASAAGGGDPAGLFLAGQVPPDEVADLLTHAAANDGVYVAASDKEEFGLAVVEAMGAGLVVVAPEQGGASTYIDQGVTGLVTDTRSVPGLRRAIADAAVLAGDVHRRDRARAMVRDDLSVSTMAERLGDLYAKPASRIAENRATPVFPR